MILNTANYVPLINQRPDEKVDSRRLTARCVRERYKLRSDGSRAAALKTAKTNRCDKFRDLITRVG